MFCTMWLRLQARDNRPFISVYLDQVLEMSELLERKLYCYQV